MTREEAIKKANDKLGSIIYLSECSANPGLRKVYGNMAEWLSKIVHLAEIGLKTRLEAEQNEPLTLDELREMLGRWVWVVVQCEHCECQGWAFVSTGYLAFLEQKIPFGSYGNKAIAYRRKPEEVLS